MGLLGLPTEVLQLIMSFLGTLSLAAVRLTCRALRESATSKRGIVTIKVPGWFTAKARATPRVLNFIYTMASLRARLEEGRHGAGGEETLGLGPHHWHTRTWLQSEMLAGVAPMVEFLCIGDRWRLSADQQGAEFARQLLYEPHIQLSKMLVLKSMRVQRPLDRATLHELVSLRHIKRLELMLLDPELSHEYVIQQICSMPALTWLDLGTGGVAEEGQDGQGEWFNFQSLGMLASGRLAALKHLAIPLPVEELQHLNVLSALTALTSLRVQTSESNGNWSSLASLTGLKQLESEVIKGANLADLSADSALTPLTFLRGLTHLDIASLTAGWEVPEVCIMQWDLSVFSHLTALHVLRCNLFQDAQLAVGDPLPVQLRFLVTATALEELDLGFPGSFWTLPRDSILAMQQAVSSLTSLRTVNIRIEDDELMHYSSPMAAFAAATSIQTL